MKSHYCYNQFGDCEQDHCRCQENIKTKSFSENLRTNLLNSFTLKELENSVTFRSVKEKLEMLDLMIQFEGSLIRANLHA